LKKRGIRAVEVSELIHTGAPLSDHIRAAISKSNLVIAVLSPKQSNANVYFEIGFADALAKRILLVVPPEIEAPSDARGLLTVVGTPDNIEAIDFALDQALVGWRRQPTRFRETGRTIPIGKSADRLIHSLDSLGDQPTELGLIAIIEDALKSSGVKSVVSQPRIAGYRPDIAVWADELDSWTRNPLIIEVKRDLTSSDSVTEAIAQVSQYMQSTNSMWGLVLYGGPVWNTRVRSPFVNVLLMNVREFLSSLKTRSFGDIIRDLRNRAVHGDLDNA
jgi:hypothetical protein